jgi:tetratricopeptide (TPR) repeat protein
VEDPSLSEASAVPTVAQASPARPRPLFPPGTIGVVLSGPDASEVADVASRERDAIRAAKKPCPLVAFAVGPASVVTDGREPSARLAIEVGPDTVTIRARSPDGGDAWDDDDESWSSAYVAAALVGVPLRVPPAARGSAVCGIACLVAREANAAWRALAPPTSEPGVVVLETWIDLVAGMAEDVERRASPLVADPDVGPSVRFLQAEALVLAHNWGEARREAQAALRAAPSMWPARLLEGFACWNLRLPEEAERAAADVLAVQADESLAALVRADCLAQRDRQAGARMLESLVYRRPELVWAWRRLAHWRFEEGTEYGYTAAIYAWATVVDLRPDDARAWAWLGTARFWRASVGKHRREDCLAAAEAFRRATELDPRHGLAWQRRGASLMAAARGLPAGRSAGWLRTRLEEARACFSRALESRIAAEDSKKAVFNLGQCHLVLGDSMTSASPNVPRKAVQAFAAALRADPKDGDAACGLLEALASRRDLEDAAQVLAALPEGVGDDERSVLADLVAVLGGRPATSPFVSNAADPTVSLARSLLALGHYRAALVLLETETRDVPRLAQRVRARAFLLDTDGVEADLRLLDELDKEVATAAREHPMVAAALVR